jgi:hypothetical protein
MVKAVHPDVEEVLAFDPGCGGLTGVRGGDGKEQQQQSAQAAAGNGGPHPPAGRRREVLSISAATWHHRCGHLWRRGFQQRRLARNRDLQLWQAAIPTDRTASSAGIEARIRHVGQRLNEALQHHGALAQRRARRHCRIQKSKLFSAVIKDIVTGKDGRRLRREQVVVGFGSASAGWGSAIPRRPWGMPNKEFCRVLSGHCRLFMIAEPYTSKQCSHCCSVQARLEGRKETGGDERWSYKVLACPGCGTFWHRDVNAARNIRTLVCRRLLRLPRPAYLRRPQGQG